MFLRCSKRHKDGKEHLYWSVVENRRLHGGRVLQRHVLYLGELNGRQEASWRKTVDLFGQDDGLEYRAWLSRYEGCCIPVFCSVQSGSESCECLG